MKISVLGSGGWGTALAILLCKKGYAVKMWSAFESEIEELKRTRENKLLSGVKIPEEIELTSCAKDVSDVDVFLLAVPSHVVKTVCRSFKQYYKGQTVVNVAKGFDEENNERLSVIIKKELDTSKVVVLSGPTHAEEVARGIPTAIVAACEDILLAESVQNLFSTEYMRVYTNTDVAGVEVCGAIKNVIALCAGISDGCGFGDNTKAALMTRGLKEISRLGEAMGGKTETFMGLTGIGDMIVTCTSMHSRNRRAGILIGKGMSADEAMAEVKMVVEGVKSCACAKALADKYNVDMPIVSTAYEVLFGGVSPKAAVTNLMLRTPKSEI